MSLENFLDAADVGTWSGECVLCRRLPYFSASPITQLGHTTIEELRGEFFRSICETQFLPAELRAQMYNIGFRRDPLADWDFAWWFTIDNMDMHGFHLFNAGASRRLSLIMHIMLSLSTFCIILHHFAMFHFLNMGSYRKESW